MRLSAVNKVVLHELLLEFRSKGAWTSVILFVVASNLVCYLSFKYISEPKIWNGIFWIIILFGSLNSASQIFKESNGQVAFLHQLFTPSELLLGKLFYNSLFSVSVAIVSTFAYFLLFEIFVSNFLIFFTALILGSMAIGALLTITSSISFKVSSGNVLLNVLSIPVLIPLLIVLISATNEVLKSVEFSTFLETEIYDEKVFNIKAQVVSQVDDFLTLKDDDGKIRTTEFKYEDVIPGHEIIATGFYNKECGCFVVNDIVKYDVSSIGYWTKIALIFLILVLIYSTGLWLFPKYWILN